MNFYILNYLDYNGNFITEKKQLLGFLIRISSWISNRESLHWEETKF